MSIVLLGLAGGAAFYLRSVAKENQISAGEMAQKVSWRVRLFALKARGGIPDLSWSELWWMAGGRRGFGLGSLFDGRGLNASVENPYTSAEDHHAAAFRKFQYPLRGMPWDKWSGRGDRSPVGSFGTRAWR